MREIKFRALVEKSGKSHPAVGGFEQYNQIIKVESITFNDDGVDLVVDENGDEYSYHDETLLAVMQYTGLKDSNGVDIYEGDIIQSYDGSDAVMMDKFTVKYDDFYTGFLPFNRDECAANRQNMEVIGNVYEHPHLLEVD